MFYMQAKNQATSNRHSEIKVLDNNADEVKAEREK